MSGLMQKIFFGGLIIYFISLVFSPGMFSVKFFALFRDLVVLGLIAQFFSFFKKSKLTFFTMLAVLLVAYLFIGKSYMQSTFHEAKSGFSKTELAENGELLVEMSKYHDISDLEYIISKYELKYKAAFRPAREKETDLDDYYLVDIPSKYITQLQEIMEEFRNANSVDWIEQNEVFKIKPIISKRSPSGKIAYGINDPDVNQLWGFEAMRMDQLYQLFRDKKVKPRKKAKIFIVDSGVDAKHEDIKARYRSANVDHDTDPNGHGTHCAGIAAAVTNNGIGVASVFPGNDFAEVTGIKVTNFLGLTTQQLVIDGIIEAIDNGADVISLSLGSYSDEAAQEAFREVVEYADKANAIIVAAAGNDNLSAIDYTPANAEGVITVTALDATMNKAYFSNMVGDLKMGIAAPGVNIYSTFPGNQYKTLSGTSMACPYVSGLVGLMKSIQPELTTRQVYEILKATGKETGNVEDTGNLIQPAKALMKVMEEGRRKKGGR